jgi:hypothetical protein
MPTILAALRHDVNVTDSKPRRLRAAELFALVCARLTDVRMVVSGGGWRVAGGPSFQGSQATRPAHRRLGRSRGIVGVAVMGTGA